ncbi:MAG: cold shock domain-containing protein [Planctomycetota bacterium]
MVMTGSVARFDARRGYGFLVPDDGGEDVFVHQNNIDMEGFRYLNPGERVRFDIEEGARGRKAVTVQLLEEREERPRPRDQDRERDRGGRHGQRGGGRAGPGGRPGRGDERLREDLDKLRRKQERLVSLLVEKGVLQPGEIDELPGLEQVNQSAALDDAATEDVAAGAAEQEDE